VGYHRLVDAGNAARGPMKAEGQPTYLSVTVFAVLF
jgi:hypothetical protein